MYLRKTDGVVLNRTDFGESDIIVTLYGDDVGKIRCIAKNAKKSKRRFMNTLQPFCYVHVILSEGRGGLIRIDQADIIRPFFRIGEDIVKILYGFYSLELVNEMTGERHANPRLLNLLVNFLDTLNTSALREEYVRFFELQLLDVLGYRPRLLECSTCSRAVRGEKGWFSFKWGGVVCAKCRESTHEVVPVSWQTLRAMEEVFHVPADELRQASFSHRARSESRDILPRYIQYHLGKRLKTLKVMEEICTQ
jgi:DNA repair protein RecO (recombination protein O)